jgi:hypothetical protein
LRKSICQADQNLLGTTNNKTMALNRLSRGLVANRPSVAALCAFTQRRHATMTVREALNSALDDEIERDDVTNLL